MGVTYIKLHLEAGDDGCLLFGGELGELDAYELRGVG